MIQQQQSGSIRISEVTRYLRKTGWQRVPHANDRLLVFRREAESGAPTVVLASRDEFSDSQDLINNALTLLAGIGHTTVLDLERAIRSQDRDVLSVRFVGASASHGGLPLETATRLILQLRDLLAYAACVEDNPRPYFPKATAIGRRYAQSCIFGHTFPGSFGFTIESLTGTAVSSASEPVPPPFERRVVSRIMRGVRQLQEAVFSGDTEVLAANYSSGLNANLCELLGETLEEAGDGEIEYSVAWSPDFPVEPDLAAYGPVRLQSGATVLLAAVARQMRRLEESRLQTINGRVVALQSDGSASGDDYAEDIEQVATILWEEKRGRKLRVRVALEPPDYANACDAHKEGIAVRVTGAIEKTGKFWRLMAPAGFELIRP